MLWHGPHPIINQAWYEWAETLFIAIEMSFNWRSASDKIIDSNLDHHQIWL